MTRRRFWPLIAVALMAGAAGFGQDTDGDGLSDALERKLATNPEFREVLEVVVEGAKYQPTPQRPARYDIVRVRFGNVAKGRWLWAIEFAEPYTFDNASVILYVDADNNPATGRERLGCEVMYSHSAGRPWIVAFAADGSKADAPAPRVGLENGVLYICGDTELNQEAGRSKFRLWILSEQREPHEGRDSLRSTTVVGSDDSDRPKPITLADQAGNERFVVTQDMPLLWRIHSDKRHVVLNAFKDCQADGFVYNHSEYRWPSMRKQSWEGTLEARAPKAGRFHLAAVVYDGPGRECYEMSLDGKAVGRFVADADNKRQRLFFLPGPIAVAKGQSIVLRAGGGGSCIVEDIILLADKPPILKPKLEARHLEVGYDWPRRVMRATWITTLPAQCVLRYDGGRVEEEEAVQNHRVYLPGLAAGKAYTCFVTAGEMRSREVKFVAGEPKPAKGSVAREQVKLSVLFSSGRGHTDWPITAGVPFPKGALGSVDHLRLLTPDGHEWPVQAKPIVRWPDRSVKVALLDTLSLRAGALVLEYGHEVRRGQPSGAHEWLRDVKVRVRQDEHTVTLANQTTQVQFDRRASGLFTRLWYPGKPGAFTDDGIVTRDDALPRVVIVDHDGNAYDTLGPAEGIVVEEAGPLRAVMRLDGHHTGPKGRFFTYQVRVTLHANAPHPELSYRWGNDVSTGEFAQLRSIRLELPLRGGEDHRFYVGTEDGAVLGGRAAQLEDDRYQVVSPGQAGKGKRAPGWVVASHPKRQIGILCRHFWQLYPKAIGAGEGMLRLDICPELAADQYTGRSEMDLFKRYFYLQGGQYKIRQGMTKTHEMLLLLGPGGQADASAAKVHEETSKFVSGLNDPPILAAPPDWYAKSAAFGAFVTKTSGRTPPYDEGCDRAYDRYVAVREGAHMYGMMNFGDLFGERRVNWSNGEYDHHHAAAQMFVRSAEARWHHLMEAMARHEIDVDLCHYHTNPRYRGASWVHSMGHSGRYFKKKYQGEWGIPGGGMTPTHTWCEGTCEYYMLTGDPSAIAAARSIADHYGAAYINHYDFTNGRVPGWHLLFTLAVYRATYDPFYLNAARTMVNRVMERRTPGSGWARQMVPGHCHCTPRCRGACSFMQGILGCGLREYYLETKDPRVPPAVIDAARYVIEQMWVDDRTAFRYTSCPESSITTSRTDTLAGLLCFAHELSGDHAFADVLLRGMAENMKRTHSITHLRWLPYVTHYLDRLSRSRVGLKGAARPALHLKAERKGRFHVRVYDRNGVGAPADAASLTAPDGQVLKPGEQGLIQVDAAAPGVYRLALAPGERYWLIDTDLSQAVMPVADEIEMDVGAQVHSIFFTKSTPGDMAVRFRARQGELDIRLLNPNGRELGHMGADAGGSFACRKPVQGRYELQLRGPAQFSLRVTGASAWAAPAPWRHFNASAPTVRIEGARALLPGGDPRIELRVLVDDPENDVLSVRWELPNGKTVDGPRLALAVPKAERFTVRATAVDKEGNEGRAEVEIKVHMPELVGRRDAVVVQAEDFTGQGVGKVKVYTRVGCVGKMVTYWHTELGHWLEWKVAVPKPGDYGIYARYATDCDSTRRSLAIDGKSPGPPYDSIQFTRTGGYCTVSDNWATKKLGPAIRLTAGEHTIRMTNLGDGLALDYLAIAKAR